MELVRFSSLLGCKKKNKPPKHLFLLLRNTCSSFPAGFNYCQWMAVGCRTVLTAFYLYSFISMKCKWQIGTLFNRDSPNKGRLVKNCGEGVQTMANTHRVWFQSCLQSAVICFFLSCLLSPETVWATGEPGANLSCCEPSEQLQLLLLTVFFKCWWLLAGMLGLWWSSVLKN